MAYARFYRTLAEAQAHATKMKAEGWPTARVVSTRQLNPDLPEYPNPDDATDTGERWLITVGGDIYVLDDDRVDRQPPN